MAKQIVTNYTFSHSAKTVTFTDFTTILLNRIMLITDVTNNTIIYQFNSSTLGGTVATNVLTLTFNTNTGSYTDAHKLQIIYDLAVGDTNYGIVQPVSAASLPLPALAATSTKQSDGTQKTQIVDGSGNVASMTSNAQDVNIKSGNLTTLPVTNAGTFAVQSTNQTQTDTVMIGGVNVKEINATTPLMGNGVTGTGSQRVTIASDNTAFSVNANAGTNLNTSALALDATLTGGTQQAQGNVASAATDSGNPVKIGGKYSSTKPTFTDGQRGDAQLGVKGALNVELRQADSGNAIIVAANGLNTTGGGLLASQIAAQFDDVSPTAITENQFGNLRMSANRNAYTTIRDAAGNERGANVSSGNALLVDASATTQPVSGTVTITPSGTQTVTGAKTNNNAAPGSTNVGVIPGIANAAVQTWTEGDQVLESMDLSGNQRTTLGTALSQAIDSILTYPFGHFYAHISTSTTTTVKSGAGVLHNISINTLGTVASTTTIYDNTAGSGTIIGVINSLTLSGAFILDVAFATGLTIVTTGTVAPDVTVSYR